MNKIELTADGIIKAAEKSIETMETIMENPDEYLDTVRFANFEFNYGQYHTFMQILYSIDTEKWIEAGGKFKGRISKLTKEFEKIYRRFRNMCIMDTIDVDTME